MNRIALMALKNFWRIPGMFGKLWHYAKHTDEYPEQEKYDHIRRILTCAVNAGNVEIQVSGTEHLPRENGYLIYGNHQGLFDIMALVVTHPGPMSSVYKKELSDIPFLKQIEACTKSFAMDREDVRQSLEVIRAVTEEVKAGRNYVIFPEGTRSKKGNVMNEFHGGSFRCALKAKCPIVPMVVIDSFKVLDQKGSKPVAMQLHYLEPIPYEAYRDLKSVDLANLVKERIQQTIDRCTA